MEQRETIRLDKWLWYARFFKTRGLATKLVSAGHVRVNSAKVSKPATAIGAGDVLTFPQASRIRVVRLLACGTRRGPAPEAQALYEDLSPPPVRRDEVPPAPRYEGKGRPTKKDRRTSLLSRGDPLE
ncbi:RNA-binding S4 domain-containing protein [Celeribacter indicus]|uniref:Heat shock protein n=1 Tax=Celeribacter indicus TaxID=1208324 RepID=A0A0B5E3N9_9RHOB|nr:RNA-binding S4 domain-containing protein [Celeribacter indicus]AJE47995.1 heat shock protein [Celeribacter indicus]SDW28951.1 heat shock protein Hsp15 [Celeribacter indicus]